MMCVQCYLVLSYMAAVVGNSKFFNVKQVYLIEHDDCQFEMEPRHSSFIVGVEMIIATPGRLNDLIMSNVVDVRSVTFLVSYEVRLIDC
jgi:superfamily II DNA/RNA helicase